MRSLIFATAVLAASVIGYVCAPTVLDAAVSVDAGLLAEHAAARRADLYANDKIPTLWPVTSPVAPRASTRR